MFDFLKLKLIIFLCFFSCGRDDAQLKKPYQARVITLNDNGNYEWKVVTLNTLDSLNPLDGKYLKIISQAEFDGIMPTLEDALSVHVKTPDYSKTVDLDYKIKNGVIYPTTFDSLAFLTIHYHYEEILNFWENHFDLNLDQFGKRHIFYDPQIVVSEGNITQTTSIKQNAAFLPILGDFFFHETSALEQIPIKLNFASLAHEFAHSIFDEKFAKNQIEAYSSNSSKSKFIINGINEGIADYYAWMVTGKKDCLRESLEFAKNRELPAIFNYGTMKDYTFCENNFYCHGTVLASALYEIAHLPEQDSISVGKILFKTIAELRKDWDYYKDTDNFEFYFIVINFLKNTKTKDKANFCKVFLKRFNDSINAPKIRNSCS